MLLRLFTSSQLPTCKAQAEGAKEDGTGGGDYLGFSKSMVVNADFVDDPRKETRRRWGAISKSAEEKWGIPCSRNLPG